MAAISLLEFHNMPEAEQLVLVEQYRKLYIEENLNVATVKERLSISDNLGAEIRSKYNIRKSQKDILATSRRSYLAKTGFSHPMHNSDVVDKQKATSFNRYGGVGFQSKELADRVKATNLRKYGVENYAQSEQFSEEYQKHCLDKYGVDNVAKLDTVKAKTKRTQQKRYGDLYCRTEEFRSRALNSYRSRYGVDNPMQSPEVRSKIESANLRKYGYTYAMSSPEFRERLTQGRRDKFDRDYYCQKDISLESIEILHNEDKLIEFIISVPEENRTIQSLAKLLGYSSVHFCQVTASYGENVRKLINMSSSVSELEKSVRDYVSSLCGDLIFNSRDIISPQELDIYSPSNRFAIEFNGYYWHSKQVGTSVDYHCNKSKKCCDRGIFLYHIFEQEWADDRCRKIIKAQLRSKLQKSCDRIFARNCEVRSVNVQEARKFLDDNHLQGYRNCTVRLGLYYNDDLVQMMTFGKAYLHKEPCWEIYRLCSTLNLVVVGGASKLFSYFLNNFDAKHVMTYSDIAKGTGAVYKSLGFTECYESSPNYVWIKDGKVLSRYQTQMKNETAIMESRGYVQLFDCGNKVWKFSR